MQSVAIGSSLKSNVTPPSDDDQTLKCSSCFGLTDVEISAHQETRPKNMVRLKMYNSSIESLNAHTLPTWFDDAKFGIFIHWGLYSIPAFAPFGPNPDPRAPDMMRANPYAEWYENTLKFEGSETAKFHARAYGNTPYADFRSAFENAAEHLPAAEWADIFKQSGAQYVTLVTKHHDGYLLWPSTNPNPHRAQWQSETDIVDKVAQATRRAGLRFGVYYSGGLDWPFNPERVDNFAAMLQSMPHDAVYDAYCFAHYKELIDRYQPDYLWNDIGYPRAHSMRELFSYYYTKNPGGLVNDRWMAAQDLLSGSADDWRAKYKSILGFLSQHRLPPPEHCDVITPEYASQPRLMDKKWETTRGIGFSFGYNAQETDQHLMNAQAIVHFLISTVAHGGNVLLNVGPRGDGTLCPHQTARLQAVGGWLRDHGEAIYGTRPWHVMQSTTSAGRAVCFTTKGPALYAIVLDDRPEPLFLANFDMLKGQSTVRIGPPGSCPQVFRFALHA